MAASGTLQMYVSSVDYGGGRGHVQMKTYINWSLNDSNYLTLSYGWSESISGSAQYWGVCGVSGTNYAIVGKIQYSTDGGNSWQDLDTRQVTTAICPSLTNTYNTMKTIVDQFGSYHLTQPGLLRVAYGGNSQPAPSVDLPNAFPSWVTSSGDQVPVNIPVVTDYFPGAIYNGSSWVSHDRSGGKVQIYNGSTWRDEKTKDGGSGSSDAPEIYNGSAWKNMRKF